ncbi:DUF4421 domain-containing protein [Flavobacterium jejuense]|uniref:DUF4421 domain-containing protein n=1 Tax=Flavobacterium jejuense TaxID=1544455 RepID=A0ABX0IQ05_9FLAO|nr:DUF4421 family protein [Flavobacterium jejuense]NHN25638.1 DUF4421 domain-containing protein [Flavobacterium jejuense]
MAIKISLLNSIVFIISVSCFSQETIVKDTVFNEKNSFIQSFPNNISTRLFFINTSNSLYVKDRNSNDFYILDPNKQDRIGATISFRSISISYSIAPYFLATNKDNEGAKLFNINLRTYFSNWMQTFDIYKEKGFYIKNDAINFYFPKIKSIKIGGSTSYILNPNFSFKSVVSQDEKQLKSAGSLIPRILYYYSEYDIVSENDIVSFESKIYSFDIALAPSYYYNFVPIKNLLLSTGISTGIGLNTTTSDNKSVTSLLTELDFSSSITYDFSNFYFGSHFSYLILNHNTDSSSYVKDNIPFIEFFLGYRFKAPKKLLQKVNKINDKLKF